MSQEIHAHQGSIWCMKFSSDSRYLASAGEDRIVRVWQVLECNFSSFQEQEAAVRSSPPLVPLPVPNGSLDNRSASLRSQPSKRTKRGKSSKKAIPDHIVIPETIFSLSEKPICSLEGHLDDVLDLSWSKSQHLLSSSMDKTVRLWDIETKSCLKLFAHNDYVTCIQFNPVDDSYFISGSLDAKVRIWSIPDRQVVDWTDLHEMVTATCYTPDGQGALVGSHKGSCRIYKTTDCKLHQEAQIDIRSKKKKSHAKKVTGFQFGPGNPSEVMITSADSQIRVFDGVKMVNKFRGFRNTSSQISASYTSDGKYVVCASEDSHVYIWKREASRSASAGVKSKSWTTTRSHEHFYCKDVSVAIPWPGCGTNCAFSPSLSAFPERSISNLLDSFPSSRSHLPPLPEKSFSERTLPCSSDEPCSSILHSRSGVGSESFVSASSSIRSSAICSSISDSANISNSSSTWGGSSSSKNSGSNSPEAASAWGLVVVTAGLGGDIRIYQNFGLPLRLSRQTNLFY
uniref:WD repeat-containing protein 44-like n=1 Tax=Ananas comosus var. bracteatus TaxID=296719 RepID=A0A6V7QDH9_ANACO|nr:unnamed protein product [Ananas comosus var. bracteatus]